MAIEIVDFPINSMVLFHGKMLVHQRVFILHLKTKPRNLWRMFDRIETIDVNPVAFRLNMTPWGVDVNQGTINRDD